MSDATNDNKVNNGKALETLLFCLWYVAVNTIFAWVMLVLWQPNQPDLAKRVLLWAGFSFATLPLPVIIWFVWGTPHNDLGWVKRIAIAFAIVLIVSIMVGIVATGIAPLLLALYGVQGFFVAILAIWVFERFKRSMFSHGS